MVGAIHHRGPDSSGHYRDDRHGCALGHNRLAIIDLSQSANQPMAGPAGHVIAFNGEVYNFRELRVELEAHGRRFQTNSDTEVVLAAFEVWGTDSFRRLNGMFAFALLDPLTARFFLVRDRLGIKPLYLAQLESTWLISSELKGILASRLLPIEINWSPLHEYLYFGSTLGQNTMYRNITKLPPAHYQVIDLATATSSGLYCYWRPDTPPLPGAFDFPSAVEKTRTLLAQAVKRQMVADVPIGLFLSGGVDSTAILSLASEHATTPLRTYTAGFDYTGDSEELPVARRIASHFGTEHHEIQICGTAIPAVIERVARAHDQPFADPANIPLLQLCEALGGAPKAILQGDGGDELFGGYRRYEYLSLPKPLVIAMSGAERLLRAIAPVYGPKFFGAHRFFLAMAQKNAADRMALLLSVEGPLNPPTRILSPELRAHAISHDPFLRYRAVSSCHSALDPLQQMLWTDLEILLPDIFLEKVDRATMALSIEVRVPFLDFDLVDYVSALPPSFKVTFGRRKRLLRQALDGIVPAEILSRRKAGFGVPISAWLAGPLRQYAEERVLAYAPAVFHGPTVSALFREHSAGVRNNAQILWKALMLAVWLGNLERVPSPPT
jgi:asparagine synthase (glutamine-hydrolysing)